MFFYYLKNKNFFYFTVPRLSKMEVTYDYKDIIILCYGDYI